MRACISRLVADEYDKWHKGSFLSKLEKMHFASFLIILHRSRVHRSIGVIPIPLEKPEMCLSPISSPLGECWHLWNFTSAFNHCKAARTESGQQGTNVAIVKDCRSEPGETRDFGEEIDGCSWWLFLARGQCSQSQCECPHLHNRTPARSTGMKWKES